MRASSARSRLRARTSTRRSGQLPALAGRLATGLADLGASMPSSAACAPDRRVGRTHRVSPSETCETFPAYPASTGAVAINNVAPGHRQLAPSPGAIGIDGDPAATRRSPRGRQRPRRPGVGRACSVASRVSRSSSASSSAPERAIDRSNRGNSASNSARPAGVGQRHERRSPGAGCATPASWRQGRDGARGAGPVELRPPRQLDEKPSLAPAGPGCAIRAG